MSGRTRTNKLCHFPATGPGAGIRPPDPAADGAAPHDPPGAGVAVGPGDLVTVRVEQAAPHHLVGGPVLAHRPWRPAVGSCGAAPAPRPLPAGAVPLPLVG
jgi:hypothetical protein